MAVNVDGTSVGASVGAASGVLVGAGRVAEGSRVGGRTVSVKMTGWVSVTLICVAVGFSPLRLLELAAGVLLPQALMSNASAAMTLKNFVFMDFYG